MTTSPKTPNQIDINVGARIRFRRQLLGFSQSRLADSLGLTFQQIQKYEKGINRVGASRLQAIATTFEVPVSFFFEGSDVSDEAEPTPLPNDFTQFLSSPEALALNSAFTKIHDPNVRRKLVALIKSLGDDDRC